MKKIFILIGILFVLAGFAFAAENNYKDGVDFAPYMKNLQKSVKANWNPPKSAIKSNSVVLMFKISKDGKLLSHSVYKSSGNASYDEAAIAALLKTSFKPLPSDFKGESVNVHFTFDYNVYGFRDSKNSNILPKNLAYNFEVLAKNMYATNKESIAVKKNYRYLKVVKVGSIIPNATVVRYKVDCKNMRIGVKRTYSGNSSLVMREISEILNTNLIFREDVYMEDIDKNFDYTRVYNYVCKPD